MFSWRFSNLAQGFKVVIRDIALHMSNRGMNYQNEDSGLCQGALKTREQRVCFSEPDASSVQEYLETSHFVQASSSVQLVLSLPLLPLRLTTTVDY